MIVALASGAANAAARAIEGIRATAGPHFGFLVVDHPTQAIVYLASNIVEFDTKTTQLLQTLQTFWNLSRQFVSEEVKLLQFRQRSKAFGNLTAELVGIHKERLKIDRLAQVC